MTQQLPNNWSDEIRFVISQNGITYSNTTQFLLFKYHIPWNLTNDKINGITRLLRILMFQNRHRHPEYGLPTSSIALKLSIVEELDKMLSQSLRVKKTSMTGSDLILIWEVLPYFNQFENLLVEIIFYEMKGYDIALNLCNFKITNASMLYRVMRKVIPVQAVNYRDGFVNLKGIAMSGFSYDFRVQLHRYLNQVTVNVAEAWISYLQCSESIGLFCCFIC